MNESLLLFFIVGIVFLFYWIFVAIPKEREEEERRDNWVKNNSETLQIQSNISKILEQIGQNHPPCKKCNSLHFQLWEVNSQITQIRCLDCKKIKNLGLDLVLKNKDGEEVSFLDFLIPYTSLVNLTMKEGNSPLGVYLKNHLIWDFGSLRNGTPIIRGITFFY